MRTERKQIIRHEHHILLDDKEMQYLLYALRTFDQHHANGNGGDVEVGQFCRDLASWLTEDDE